MKDDLIQAVIRVIHMLDICGMREQVDWFKLRLNQIQASPDTSDALKPYAKEIRGILAGMGSLSDLSLDPPPNSEVSECEANQMKWALVDELDRITRAIIK